MSELNENKEKRGYKSRYGNNPDTLKMDFEHTEVHQMTYDFSIYLHKKVLKFPKYEKFTLSKEIRETVDLLLDEIETYEVSKTISHLYSADRLKRRLVRKIRTANDLRYSAMNNSSYAYCAEQLGYIGGCLGNLIKKAQEEKRKK